MRKRRVERGLTGAALLFAALGDPTRLALLRQLSAGGPASISTLAEKQAITRQGVTKHLHVLEAAGVIDGRREGREQVWALNPDRLVEARRQLDAISSAWDDALARFRLLVEE
jgi:DNA-binding transcriptional ArsR family regulator